MHAYCCRFKIRKCSFLSPFPISFHKNIFRRRRKVFRPSVAKRAPAGSPFFATRATPRAPKSQRGKKVFDASRIVIVSRKLQAFYVPYVQYIRGNHEARCRCFFCQERATYEGVHLFHERLSDIFRISWLLICL